MAYGENIVGLGVAPLQSAARSVPLFFAVLLAACASHEGTYTPACMAFAGDEVRLEHGRFAWDKFTDQVRLDGEGEPIDPFPDHPIHGRYRVVGNEIVLEPDTARPLPPLYLERANGRFYIMTADQLARRQRTGVIDDCVLVRGGPRA